MLELVKKTVLAGAGLAVLTAERLEGLFAEWVKKGEITEQEAKEAVADLTEKSKQARRDLEDWLEKQVARALGRLSLPTRMEIEELERRIARLEQESGKER